MSEQKNDTGSLDDFSWEDLDLSYLDNNAGKNLDFSFLSEDKITKAPESLPVEKDNILEDLIAHNYDDVPLKKRPTSAKWFE